jgi:hypothetical protein
MIGFLTGYTTSPINNTSACVFQINSDLANYTEYNSDMITDCLELTPDTSGDVTIEPLTGIINANFKYNEFTGFTIPGLVSRKS